MQALGCPQHLFDHSAHAVLVRRLAQRTADFIKRAGRALGKIEAALRSLPRPVIGHISNDSLWLDLRCLESRDEPLFTQQLGTLAEAMHLQT